MLSSFLVLLFAAFYLQEAACFVFPRARMVQHALMMADVEVIFPPNKKVKVPSGSPLKDAAKKAGFSPSYGCEEGKCGSCELKMNGKQKIRPCIGKVPASATPIKLENL